MFLQTVAFITSCEILWVSFVLAVYRKLFLAKSIIRRIRESRIRIGEYSENVTESFLQIRVKILEFSGACWWFCDGFCNNVLVLGIYKKVLDTRKVCSIIITNSLRSQTKVWKLATLQPRNYRFYRNGNFCKGTKVHKIIAKVGGRVVLVKSPLFFVVYL